MNLVDESRQTGIITMSIFGENALIWLKYFELTRNRVAKVWLLSDEPSRIIYSTRDFNSGKRGISIIDPFDGRRPWLLNYNYYKFYSSATRHESFNTGFIPTFVLDSQIITYFTQYLNSSDRTNAQHECIHSFLRFVIKSGYDFNPFFYYMESAVKNGVSKAKEYAITSAISVLQLQTMHKEIFLRENRITPDWEEIEVLAARYGLNSINDNSLHNIATLWVDKILSDICESNIDIVKEIIDYTYATLLKMVLIHKASKQNVVKKMKTFYNFLECEFNLVLGRETAIAAYYFSNQLPDKFIQIQAEMSFADVRRKMISTAWDFLLLRIPEIQLFNGTEQQTSLCYICSGDNAVRKLGRLFTIESVISLSPEQFLPSGISFKLEELRKNLGEDVVDILCEHQKDRQMTRSQMLVEDKVKPISKEQLKILISSLEDEVKKLCKR